MIVKECIGLWWRNPIEIIFWERELNIVVDSWAARVENLRSNTKSTSLQDREIFNT